MTTRRKVRGRAQRGGAYLYVIVCVSVMGLLLVNVVPYVTQARNMQMRRALQARVDLTTEALVQQVNAEAAVQPISNNSPRSLTLNGATASATITDGSATVPNSYYLSGATTLGLNGQKFKFARYVSQGIGTLPYDFAFYSANDMTWSGKLITGAAGADGDVFCNGKIALGVSGTRINGNVSARNSISISGGSVTGSTLPNSAGIAMPAVSALDYQTNASSTLFGNQALYGGVAFSGTVNGHYPIRYFGGDVTFQGVVSGQGVIFVNGNVVFNGNVTYANSSSRVALIVTGSVVVNAEVSQLAGILYIGGSLIDNSADLNVTRGSIVASRIISGPIIRATRDNFLQTGSTEGTKLCLPGYWP